VASLDALAKVLPVLLLIGLGAFFRRTEFVRPGTVDDLRRLVLGVTLPAALFLTFLRVTIEGRYALVVVGVFAACLLMFGAGLLAVRFAGVRPGVVPGLLAGFEGGMIGYAVYGAVFGQEELYHFAIVDLGQMPFVFFILATWLTRRASGEAASLRDAAVAFVRTPVVIAIVAGIAGSAVGLGAALEASPLGDGALRTLGLLGALTTPLIAIVIGYSTRLRRGALGAPLGTVAVRLTAWVAFALVFNAVVVDGLLGLDRLFQAAIVTMAVLPPPFVVPLYLRAAARRRAEAGGGPGGEGASGEAQGDVVPSDAPQDVAPSDHERVTAAEHEFAVNTLSLATVATLVAFVAVSVAFAG
jgi:predicted permease